MLTFPNFAGSKCDFLSNHYLISRIKSDVSTGDTTIGFMVGGYAWKMNVNELGLTPSFAPPNAIWDSEAPSSQNEKTPRHLLATWQSLGPKELLIELLKSKTVLSTVVTAYVRVRPGLLQHIRKPLDHRKYWFSLLPITRLLIWRSSMTLDE